MSDQDKHDARKNPDDRSLSDESGIIVFGGGGRGCSTGCLFWILISLALSVVLTVLVNLLFYLLSSPVPGIPGVEV